jgi:putative nucleotidyltransferase with HDIG domain
VSLVEGLKRPDGWAYFTIGLEPNMSAETPDRASSVALLESWVENVGLRKHMLAVEASVRHYARIHGEDEDLWGTAGLLHDLDWEKYPDEHPHRGLAELKDLGYPDAILQAIAAHAPERTKVEPDSLLDRVLFACDEISGLVYACCLVRPNGIDDLAPKSVTKKLKDKGFAAGVNREDVARGVELLGLERAEHIQNVIDGMRNIADVLEVRAEDRL